MTESSTITFRCPPELETIIPRPIAAALGIPDWFKAMPQTAISPTFGDKLRTLKKCPPFIDAMTQGFLIPLMTDVHVDRGTFSWDFPCPANSQTTYPRSPLDFHDSSQVAGSPFFAEDQFIVKFNNCWTIALPEGHSLLVTHPVNRRDLPFVTLTGLVDSDRYQDNFIFFPALWTDPSFSGVLPKGTPVAQCIPIRRGTWTAEFGRIEGPAAERLHETATAVSRQPDVYRRQYRVAKR